MLDVFEAFETARCAVFVASPEKAELVRGNLQAAGVACVRDSDAEGRAKFEERAVRVMICTDELARDGLTGCVVLHYDLSRDVKSYVSRIGAKSDAGSRCVSIAFVTSDEVWLLIKLETDLGRSVGELPANMEALIEHVNRTRAGLENR